MSKINFNEHLDDMMERLMNEDITPEELELEIKRAKAICEIADRKIEHNKTVVLAARLISNGDVRSEVLGADLQPKKLNE
jgi:hypothetical protein